jgi:hypothetical protein
LAVASPFVVSTWIHTIKQIHDYGTQLQNEEIKREAQHLQNLIREAEAKGESVAFARAFDDTWTEAAANYLRDPVAYQGNLNRELARASANALFLEYYGRKPTMWELDHKGPVTPTSGYPIRSPLGTFYMH